MTFAEYAAIDAVNWSLLRELRKSPKHYRYRSHVDREDADVLRLGRASHTAVLEPDRFLLDYSVWRGGRRAGKDWEAFSAAATDAGVTVLTMAQYQRACAIRDEVRAHGVASKILAVGKPEQSLLWTDAATGRKCKARLDWVGGGVIADLKTARTIIDRPFAAAVANYGYHAQLAFYRAGWKAITNDELPCLLLAVEHEPPHDVAVYRLNEDALYAGDEEIRELLTRLVECEAAGAYPGRYPDEVELQLPAWAFPEDESMEDSAGAKWLLGTSEEG